MSFKVKSTAVFEKQAKRLSKKFPSLKIELGELIQKLKEKPELGTPIGKNCYKIRISIASKRKGKSGGARVIINIVISRLSVYLLNIYDKSEKGSLTNKELRELLNDLPE
ncbi:MAG: hypothetical protein JJE07_01480 [Flavobacteriaceae bacterium]|nr:hypothetical protein [Flavobacteriaceae bacterium]